MFRGRFLGFLVVVLLVVGLLGLAGSSIYRAGWTQGYFVGKVTDGAATGETTVITPDSAPGQLTHFGRGFGPAGSLFGTVLRCLLMLLLFGMFFKFIGFLMWRGRGGWGKGWHKRGGHGHWHRKSRWGRHHDGSPPWYDDEADEPMKA
jgi:hypothetical protein